MLTHKNRDKVKDGQSIVSGMVASLGLSNESQLRGILNISQAAISKWKSRNSIPEKYQKMVLDAAGKRCEAANIIADICISVEEVSEALGIRLDSTYQLRKNNQTRYELIVDGLKLQKAASLQPFQY